MIAAIIQYRRVIIFGILILAFMGVWLHGYFYGGNQFKLKVLSEQKEEQIDVKENVESTKIKEQGLDDIELDRSLCDLRVVRKHSGC